jgi:site-specific DNA recombinase
MWGRSEDDARPKVALYARYSTDNQSVVSIEDQLRICREHAGRECWEVVDTYQDAAISGASVILQPGVQSLLQDAQRGRFDIVRCITTGVEK